MGFNVTSSRKQIKNPLEKYCDNRDISSNWPLLIKGEKEIKFLLEGRRNVS